MKINAPRRSIINDALDLYTPTRGVPVEGYSLVELPIALIKPYHDHPFHLYSGTRLDDMVESIRDKGVLVPVIVQPLTDGYYEMLAGHNRMNAASLAGLNTIPAIIKEGLTDSEARYYVIETNVIQRSFSELLPSEQAAVISIHYSEMISQGRRNDIDHELRLLSGCEQDESPPVERLPKNSRKELAEAYSLSSTTVARLLKINDLLPEFKRRLDSGKLPLVVSVEIAYLSEDEQQWLLNFLSAYKVKLDKTSASMLHQKSKQGGLTEDGIRTFMLALDREKSKRKQYQNMKVSKRFYQKYFANTPQEKIEEIISSALEQYFSNSKIPGNGNK